MSLLLSAQERLMLRMRRRDAPALAALLQAKPGQRVLDLGGGTGAVAALVAPACSVTIVEPDARKAAHGRAHRPRLIFVEAGAERLPFPDASFDAALMLLSFHHMPDQTAALRELRRVLVPGARLVVQEIPPSTGLGHFVHWWENRVRRMGCAFHEAPAMRALLERAGFRDVELSQASKGYFLAARSP